MYILIVDDDIGIAELLKKLLSNLFKDESIKIEASYAVKDTINLLHAGTPDLMILDFGLPIMNAQEMINLLKEQGVAVPTFIVSTGQGDEKIAVEMMKLGAKDYIIKDADFLKNIPKAVKRIIYDIESERKIKKAEEALSRSEETYRALISGLPDIIMRFDKKGRHIFVSENIRDAFNISEHKMIGKTHTELDFPEEQCKLWENTIAKTFKSKKKQEIEFIIKGEKSNITFNWRLIPEFNKNNEVESVLTIARDITKQKTAADELKEKNEMLQATEEELTVAYNELKHTYKQLENEKAKLEVSISLAEESEAKYRELAEMLPETIYETDLNYEITFMNKSGLRKFKLNRNSIKKGVNLFDCFDQKEHSNLIKSFERSLKGIRVLSKTFIAIKNDGTTFPALIHNNVIRESSKIVGLRGIITDISELRNSERLQNEIKIAEHTSKLKEQFLANMSHEMRTPMTGIIGMTDFLSDTNLSQQQQEYVDVIKNSSESLLFLINDILDISKIEQGKMTLNPEIIDIDETIDSVINIFSGSIKQKNLKLIKEFDSAFPNNISIDINRFKQVISNLLSNAVKYTQIGSIKIKLTAISVTEFNVIGKINIIDTGIGISNENLQKIFEVFSRIDDSYTKKTEGTGLGLSISKQLAKLMRGDIGAESIKGQGSNFWFTFSAGIANKIKPKRKPNIEQRSNIEFLGHNVLLAEDKIVNQKVIGLMLNNAGCKVTIANNGLEVLRKYKPGIFDVILMDIMMPEMDGITTIKKLKQKYKSLPPIIGLSAHAMQGDAEKFIYLGMDDYMEKPIKKEILLNKLLIWARKRKGCLN